MAKGCSVVSRRTRIALRVHIETLLHGFEHVFVFPSRVGKDAEQFITGACFFGILIAG